MGNLSFNLRDLLKGVLFLFVLILVEPSIILWGVNLKMLSSVLLVIIIGAATCCIKRISLDEIVPFILKSIVFIAIIICFMLVGLLHGFHLDHVTGQVKAILSAYIVYAVLRFSIYLNWVNKKDVYRAVVVGALVFFVVKFYVITLLVTGHLDIGFFSEQMVSMLGPDTAPPVNIGEGVVRLQLPNEIIGIFALGILWYSPIEIFKYKWMKHLMGVVIFLGIVSTMSRYLMIWVAVIAGYGFMAHYMGRQKLLKVIIISAIGLSLIVLFGQDLMASIFTRYNSEGSEVVYGDQLRVLQYRGLISEFFRHPIWGTGLGGYTYEIVRNEFNPWMYEAQMLALIVQFGVFGTIALTFVVMNGFSVRKKTFRNLNNGWALIFGGWILASFSNPYLLSSLSGIMFWLSKQNLICSVEMEKT